MNPIMDLYLIYHKNRKYWDRQRWANSLDLDQTPQSMVSDLGQHFLQLFQLYFKYTNR